MTKKISKHITYMEAVKSQSATRLGITNEPNEEQLKDMKIVAAKCFEPLREWHGKPIAVSSFFRSPKLNKAIGGISTSQHCKGQAIDIDADVFNNGITNADIFHWLKDNVDFDQLIWEYGTSRNPAWVHISYVSSEANRRQVLRVG